MKRLLNKFSSAKGFTLIELLIVITIIAALAIAVFVALNPGKRVQDANNARRAADADTILTAIHTSIVDNDGDLPAGITTPMAETQLGTGTIAQCGSLTGNCTVGAIACVNPTLTGYLKTLPIDPDSTTWSSTNTGYTVSVVDNIVTIKSCGAQGTTISVSR